MAQFVNMPKEGITVESCLVGAWRKDIGDTVAVDDVLFEYETDKAAFECLSTAAGVLLHKFFGEGEEAPVLTPVAIIGDEGEDVSALIHGEDADSYAAESAITSDAEEDIEAEKAESVYESEAKTEEAAESETEEEETYEEASAETIEDAETEEEAEIDTEAGEENAIEPETSAAESEQIKVSPRARSFAEEHGLDPSMATPTGPDGRILEADMIAVAYERYSAEEEEPAAISDEVPEEEIPPVIEEEAAPEEEIPPVAEEEEAPEEEIPSVAEEEAAPEEEIPPAIEEEAAPEEETPPVAEEEAAPEEETPPPAESEEAFEEEIPPVIESEDEPEEVEEATEVVYIDEKYTKIRTVIAKTMVASLQRGAQLTHHHSFDATSILSMREEFKACDEDLGYSGVSVGDIILYVTSRILAKHPDINALVAETGVRKFFTVNLGFAVDTPRGLLVPTIFGAEKKSLREISREVKAMAMAAKEGRIGPDYLAGGTFTVSNLGATGVEVFTPIINPPQAAIAGITGIVERVRKGQNGCVEVYPSIGVSLTYDHRAIDGAPASRFADELCRALADFSWKTLALENENEKR